MVGQIADDGQVVRDEDERRPRSAWSSLRRLTIAAWTETSSAETGSSATITSGFAGERPRDRDALALAARELVGLARGEFGRELHDREEALRFPARRRPSETPQAPEGPD